MSQDRGRGTTLGDRLRQLREAGGWTQEELAARAHLTAKGIAAIERGRSRRPLPQTLRALAAALGLATEETRLFFALANGQEAPPAAPAAPAPPTPRTMLSADQLPVPLTPLVGREGAVAAVAERLTTGGVRLITLTGPGGVGKTRLALASASAGAPGFPDGVAFVPLIAFNDPVAVIPAIAHAVGVQEGQGRSLRDLLHTWARERRTLLILDNLEHLLDATPEIAALLAAGPQLAVLATSRAPLRLQGEQEWLVPPLATPDAAAIADDLDSLAAVPAMQLFLERARAVLPDFTLTPDHAVPLAAICQRLDGLPLALELAAVRLRVLPPAALLDRLDTALPLLTGGARDLPAHQRTMRDTIAWSYALLPQAERTLLRRLGVFVGGWTLAMAEALLATPDEATRPPDHGTTLASLSDLVEQSLVVRDADHDEREVRYRFLEPIRQFALEQLAECGEEEQARAAHATAFLALARTSELGMFGEDQARWLDLFEIEHGNLRAALDWFFTHGTLDDAARLGWLLHRFWWIRGHFGAARRWRAAILPQREQLSPTLHALALLTAAFLTYAEGDHATTGALLTAGLPLARAVDQPVIFTLTLGLGGLAALGRGETGRARMNLTEALAVAETTGDRWDIGMMQNFLGYVALAEGDEARARTCLEEAESSWRSSGSRWDLAINLTMRSALAEWRSDDALAEALVREGMALLRPLGDTWVSVYALGQFAGVAIGRGDYLRAARLLGATEQLRDTTGTTILFASDRALHERRNATLRAVLSEAEFSAAWAAGQRLTLPQALAEAEELTARSRSRSARDLALQR